MEIIVSVVVLAIAVIPLLWMFVGGRKTAALTEYHVLAQMRARRILEAFASYPYEALKGVTEAEGGGLLVPLPASDSGFPPEYQKRIAMYDELTFFQEAKPGLGRLTVKITWTLASDGKKREYLLHKLVAEEALSLSDSYPLRQKKRRFRK